VFEAKQAVSRFEKLGDLFEPVLELKQRLPDPKKTAVATPEAVEIAAQADEPQARKPRPRSKRR
jgi:hypothetical protein